MEDLEEVLTEELGYPNGWDVQAAAFVGQDFPLSIYCQRVLVRKQDKLSTATRLERKREHYRAARTAQGLAARVYRPRELPKRIKRKKSTRRKPWTKRPGF